VPSASGEVGRGKCFGNGPKTKPGRTGRYGLEKDFVTI
jgi:hypothetical protein